MPTSKLSIDELYILITAIENSLMELAKVPIPTVFHSPSDTWYTYTYSFGQNPINSIESLIMDFTDLHEDLSFRLFFLDELQMSDNLHTFIANLQSHVSAPHLYPDINTFIQKRVELPSVLEPIIRSLQTNFERYQISLLSQDMEKGFLLDICEDMEPLDSAVEVVSLKRLDLNAYLIRPEVVAELNIRHKQLIAQRRYESIVNMHGFNSIPHLTPSRIHN